MTDTVYAAFCATVARHPKHPFLDLQAEAAAHYEDAARAYTYDETLAIVEVLRDRYHRAGYGQGHRAGLLLDNRPAFFFHWLALNALGVSVVPINSDWRSAELEYLIAHSDICVAIVQPKRVAVIRGAAKRAGKIVAVVEPQTEQIPTAPGDAPLADRAIDTSSECALLYTSGSTGRPKGCVLANEYFLWAGEWYATIGGLCEVRRGAERLLTPLPMSHMNAMAYSTMVMLRTGGCIIPLDRFHPNTWLTSVRDSRATIVHVLGVMPAMLLAAKESALDRAHEVRFGFGAGVNERHHLPFEARFGFPLLEAWAMTETGAGAVVIANREPRKVGTACFGRAQSSIEYRIVGDDGNDAGPNAPGELWVRRSGTRPRFGFFVEYLKDPAATAEAWESGYFHTGDTVLVDADRDFHFIDRKKNLIRRSGENISPVEVESVLVSHPQIASVGVTAIPDAVRGDEVMACVVPKAPLAAADHAALARDIVQFALAQLSYFKAPGFVAFCTALPLTPTAKIRRGQLSEYARELVARGEIIDTRLLKKRQG
jgi:acyl-CoA synthetase (AMP-forming)/AMP-acid ligase II